MEGSEVISKDEWHDVDESKRIYTFPGGEKIAFNDVKRVRASNSHTHFLEGLRGEKHIVRNTWLSVEIEGKWIDP
jgi:hypothetical protein